MPLARRRRRRKKSKEHNQLPPPSSCIVFSLVTSCHNHRFSFSHAHTFAEDIPQFSLMHTRPDLLYCVFTSCSARVSLSLPLSLCRLIHSYCTCLSFSLSLSQSFWIDRGMGAAAAASSQGRRRVRAASRARRSQSASTSVSTSATTTREYHGRRTASVLTLVSLVGAAGEAPPARAQVVEVSLSNITYEPCGRAGGAPGTGSFRARCFKIIASAYNPSSQPLFNADVYGKVVDADNDPCLRSGRVGTIERIPSGTSQIELKITVAASQTLPLSLSKFKAEGFTQEVNRCERVVGGYNEEAPALKHVHYSVIPRTLSLSLSFCFFSLSLSVFSLFRSLRQYRR